MWKLNDNVSYVMAFSSLIILIICVYLISHFRSQAEAIACDANLSILDKDRTIDFHMNISFDNGDGFITIAGRDSASDAILRIRKTFSYLMKKNNVMVMYNDASIMNYSNGEEFGYFKKYLPAFFFSTRPEQKMLTRVIRVRDDTLVFMIVDTPLFVCEVKR
ncbi:hypothetical protein SB6411_03220 [Klebsiella spallanzanii]|uniref:FidL-like membrane protein n=1 Tax=Klebsiella spallanzanii TaxID=2587528 RepID=A0ABY6VPN7_9ENTR|nr:hypothetical protein [Klebsiella spallanzanii]MDM4208604.1 hypothetical protein [Klebsiella spallanzanii]VUS85585.1 hypothetical protein SB6411_03220 [Klebsiella spallanzanii]